MHTRTLFAGVLAALLASAALAQTAPISGLPAATTPLAGTELVPCVQSAPTVSKCTAASLGSNLAPYTVGTSGTVLCLLSSNCTVSGNWSLNGALSGTGLSNYLASPPAIGATLPAAGSFTTINASGLISPSSTVGIKGTATNDNAQAGSIGEYACAQVTNGGTPTGCGINSPTPVAMTTTVSANITGLSLTAGDWDVCGQGFTVVAGATVTSYVGVALTTTSATFPSAPNGGALAFIWPSTVAGQANYLPAGCARFSFASATTVDLVGNAQFGSGTLAMGGFIGARRVR